MAQISIDTIESELADRGLVTHFTGMDEGTSFTITGGSKVIEILDGVSGDKFDAEDVIEAIVYGSGEVYNATREFEDVETVEDFLKAVSGIFA